MHDGKAVVAQHACQSTQDPMPNKLVFAATLTPGTMSRSCIMISVGASIAALDDGIVDSSRLSITVVEELQGIELPFSSHCHGEAERLQSRMS